MSSTHAIPRTDQSFGDVDLTAVLHSLLFSAPNPSTLKVLAAAICQSWPRHIAVRSVDKCRRAIINQKVLFPLTNEHAI